MKFGTDGIRGVYGSELTEAHAYKIGYEVARLAAKKEKEPKIVVGRDTRASGATLQTALVCGIQKGGAKAEILGVVPTPAVQFYSKNYSYGIMITASHNSAEFNGIKVFANCGTKLGEKEEQLLERALNRKTALQLNAKAVSKKIRPTAYTKNLQELIKKSSKKVAIDCANGAASKIAKHVFKSVNVVWLHASPNGKNINKHCGSTNIKGLQEAVIKNKCDIGFAFDGDADRCLAVDENGNVITGDNILYILAKSMKKSGRLLGCVVGTELSTISLADALKKYDIDFVATKTGDRHVQTKMSELGCNLGGERSGHIIIADRSKTGDGMLTAIEVLNVLESSKKKASCLSKGFTSLHREEINVAVKNEQICEAIKIANELNESLVGERVLIRKSGTENLIRIMCESGSKQRARMFATYFQALLES